MTRPSMRPFLVLVVALIVGPFASAQEARTAAQALPFASAGNTVELALGGDAAKTSGLLTVVVNSAPAWLAFEQTEATPGVAEWTDEPVVRLSFSVTREAPVGVPADIVLTVRDEAGVTVGEKTVRVEVDAPATLSVEPPRPNPSRGFAVVPYLTPVAGPVRVSVFDLSGREVAVLVDADEAAGAHEARITAGHLASGIYAVRVSHGTQTRIARLTIGR